MSDARPLCERLDWDSRFFGVSIARATPSRVDPATSQAMLDWCRAQAIDCLYFLADADDPASARVLEESGFAPVDVRVILELESVPSIAHPPGTRGAGPADIQALREIAAISHRDSRFYNDPRFDRERCDEFYRVWIENSCKGWADHVVVVEKEGIAIGYLTVHLRNPEVAVLGLMGVDPTFRRQGIGGQLLDGALAWASSRSAKRASLATQGRNSASQGFFQNAGFRPISHAVWYHRWFARTSDER